MAFLQRVLKVQAAVWALGGVLLGLVPRWLIHDAFGQPPMGEHAWVRAAGVMAVVLAMLMVLVAQRVTDVWWWAWAFALLEAGVATVFVVNAAFGLHGGAEAWPWWTLGGLSVALGALDLVGITAAGREKPIVP
ncbi:MAG TPA: hypothetical protein VLA82_08255 [Actinomycetota bacterium]|nr:hypothetical protein [Actinomycetota bacterium]